LLPTSQPLSRLLLIVLLLDTPQYLSLLPPTLHNMASNRARRIAKEIADIKTDHLSKIFVEVADGGDDLTHLRGQFYGPPDTPYEGGTFYVDIKIPSDYPFRPPIMKFETKIWHPNVSSQTVSLIRYNVTWRQLIV